MGVPQTLYERSADMVWMLRRHGMDYTPLAVWQFTGICNEIPWNWLDLLKLLYSML